MLNQEINEQLGLLQKELLRLKTVTDCIDEAKENSISIIEVLEIVQQNYAIYMKKIFSLYKNHIDDLKNNIEIQINEGVLKFETTGNKIDTTNKEKLVETKHLLEQYKKLFEASNDLVSTLEAVDFPIRLLAIDKNIQSINSAIADAKQSIENKQAENQIVLNERFDQQFKEIKFLKTMFFSLLGLVVLVGGVAVTILLK